MNAIMVAASIKNGSVVVKELKNSRGRRESNSFDNIHFVNKLTNLTSPIWGIIEDGEIDQVNALYGIEFLPAPVTILEKLLSIGACRKPSKKASRVMIDSDYLMAAIGTGESVKDIDYAWFDVISNKVFGKNWVTGQNVELEMAF